MNKYKITALVSGMMLLLALPVLSRAEDPEKPRIGIKGGVNFSNLYTNDESNSDMTTGFNIGFFSKLPVSKTFALQTELYYTRKGAEVTYDNAFAKGTAKFNLHYLEIPVLAVINITEHFNVHAGPYAAFLLRANVINKSNVNLFNFENNLNNEDFNRFEAGIAAGAGIDVSALNIGIRYNYGFTKVGKERSFFGTNYTYPDAKNGVISMYVSLSLN